MQIATVPVQICTDTKACAYNFLTIFSLSSLYLTLSSLSLRRTTLSFFLSSDQSFFLSSIFLPLASVDRHRCAANRFFFLCFSLFLGWMDLISGFWVECLSPSPSPPLAFGGVDLVSRSRHRHRRRRSCCSRRDVDLDNWVLIHFARFVFLVFCRWVVWIPVWYWCGL